MGGRVGDITVELISIFPSSEVLGILGLLSTQNFQRLKVLIPEVLGSKVLSVLKLLSIIRIRNQCYFFYLLVVFGRIAISHGC